MSADRRRNNQQNQQQQRDDGEFAESVQGGYDRHRVVGNKIPLKRKLSLTRGSQARNQRRPASGAAGLLTWSQTAKSSAGWDKLPYTLPSQGDCRAGEILACGNIGVFRHWNYRSAKRPVIQICKQCGALLLDAASNCNFCDAVLVDADENLEAVPVGVSAPAAADETKDSAEPEWRREVSRRLEAYRVRRGRPRPDDSQSGLPFAPSPAASRESETTHEISLYEEDAARLRLRAAQRAMQKQRQNERVEINIQPELDFSASPGDRAHPQTALVPVASLEERRRAGMLDALFLALTAVGFLGLFRSLGGQLVMERVDAAVYLAAFFLFYAQYFFLFTTFAGATPGMQLRELTIVRLDGSLPDTPQLLWRSFGYVLSGATLLGFFWALWDEDRFTWQDRISQTYITAATPLMEPEAFEIPAGHRHRLAHK